MRRRIVSVLAVVACGGSCQVTGCQSEALSDILLSNFRDAAVGVGTFVVESTVDNALRLDAGDLE